MLIRNLAFFFATLVILFGGMNEAVAAKAAQETIPTEVYWKRVHPHVLPQDHPAYIKMQEIFTRSRPIIDENTLTEAGFKILYRKPRSFIRVVKHPALPGYLLKVYLDTELRKKHDREGWEWLVMRCEGAAKVRRGIAKARSKHFVVAQKWLYVLPPNPPAPRGKNCISQPLVLLVEDMKLASLDACKHAWRHSMTPEHLNELYQILSIAGGASLRPDNICLTKNGQFAFIDTEYPNKKNYYDQVLPYLNSVMRAYWQHLIENKGTAGIKKKH